MLNHPDYSKIVVGFIAEKGLMLDLDNITFRSAQNIAEGILSKYKMRGYLIVKSSHKNYHIIFDRTNISWKTTLKIIFTTIKAISWGIQQGKHGFLTLRITNKRGDIPKIVYQKGQKVSLIREYLEVYRIFNRGKE